MLCDKLIWDNCRSQHDIQQIDLLLPIGQPTEILQVCVSLEGPSHSVPLFIGAGLLQSRVLKSFFASKFL